MSVLKTGYYCFPWETLFAGARMVVVPLAAALGDFLAEPLELVVVRKYCCYFVEELQGVETAEVLIGMMVAES